MSSNIVANIYTTGDFTANTLIYPGVFTSSETAYLKYANGSVRLYGNVALGINTTTPTQELDLSTDLARKLSTTLWTIVSDERIKTNIQTANLVRCAEIVDTLDLKYFEWKRPTDDQHSLGWIAQDVQTFFPKSVEPDSDGILMLNSDQLIKVLYGALKQTQLEFFPVT